MNKYEDLSIMDMSKEDFEKLEYNNNGSDFNSLVIVPMNKLHDSGFQCMKYVGVKDFKIVNVFGGASDVLHINGIGGYGDHDYFLEVIKTNKVDRLPISIDCLPCGLVRLMFSNHKMETEQCGCSDISIYDKGVREYGE